MSRPRLVASVPAAAIEHLLALVLAEQVALDGVERSWPAERTWPVARDRALERLHDEADRGVERSVRTLNALVQATYDLQFVAIIDALGEDGGDG